MSERWLVTGARGFLGRHVCAALRQRGIEVVPLDRTPPAQENGLVADIAEGVPDLGASPFDVAVHLASLLHHNATAERFEQVIVGGTRNVLAALDRLPAQPRALIYASSVAAYGLESGEMLPESTPTRAETPYGGGKRQAESIVSEWADGCDTTATVMRLPALAGEGMAGSMATLVRALRSSRYFGIGPGSARRSLVMAGDVGRAMPALADTPGTYHLTDRAHPSFRELEEAICRRLDRPLPRRIPIPAARLIALAGDTAQAVGVGARFNSEVLRKTTSTLTFDDSLAAERIGWAPAPVIDQIDVWMPRG